MPQEPIILVGGIRWAAGPVGQKCCCPDGRPGSGLDFAFQKLTLAQGNYSIDTMSDATKICNLSLLVPLWLVVDVLYLPAC